VGEAGDTLARVTAAWSERKASTEAELAARKSELETGLRLKKEALDAEIAATRSAWKEEEAKVMKARADEASERELTRLREETEYAYARDRTRKLDEDAYGEKVAAHERELRERKTAVEKDLGLREAALKAREAELAALKKEVDAQPKALELAVTRARDEAVQALRHELEHKAALAAMERDWERKLLEQRIAHLQAAQAELEKKNAELRDELALAQKQVQDIATKAIEGASQTRAFQSVNQIALEQARRPDPKSKE